MVPLLQSDHVILKMIYCYFACDLYKHELSAWFSLSDIISLKTKLHTSSPTEGAMNACNAVRLHIQFYTISARWRARPLLLLHTVLRSRYPAVRCCPCTVLQSSPLRKQEHCWTVQTHEGFLLCVFYVLFLCMWLLTDVWGCPKPLKDCDWCVWLLQASVVDLKSKEEKDAELDRKIEALRKKNEALVKRHQVDD